MVPRQTTFKIDRVIQPIYTGGDVATDDEGRLLVSCLGEEVLLTDLTNGNTLGKIEGDGEVVTALRIDPSASYLVVCSRSLSMRIYSLVRNGNKDLFHISLLKTLKPHNTPVLSAAIDSSGSLVATGCADGAIKVWDLRGGYLSHTFRGHTGIVSVLRFLELPVDLVNPPAPLKQKRGKRKHPTQDGSNADWQTPETSASGSALCLASGGADGRICIWDLKERTLCVSLESHVSVVRGLDFSAAQAAFVSGSRDKTLIIWNARNWKILRTIPTLESIEAAGFFNEGQFSYGGGEHGKLRVWETRTGQELTKEQSAGGEGEAIIDVIPMPLHQRLLCVHADQALVLHSTRPLTTFPLDTHIDPLPVLQRISGTYDEVIDVAYVGANKALMALATNAEDIKLVSVESPTEANGSSSYFGAEVGQLRGHKDIVICLDADWSTCWLATGAKDNVARLWRIDHASKLFESVAAFTGHAESIGAIAMPSEAPSPDSAAFKSPLHHPPNLLITGSQDKTIKVWQIRSNLQDSKRSTGAQYTRKAHDKDINALSINHDSTLFASASQDRTVKIWSVQGGEMQGILRGHQRGVWSVKFAPKEASSIVGDHGAVSSGRGMVLTGSGDKTVKIWSLTDCSCVRTFEGHMNTVLKVLWLPQFYHHDSEAKADVQSSPLVVSAGSDGLVKVWDAGGGECSTTLDNHTDRVWALAVDAHKGHLVSGGGDGFVTFWVDTTASTAAATAAASTERVEQEQELENYILRGNYRDAIVLSLQLNHPMRLLSIFREVVEKYPQEQDSLCGMLVVDEVLGALGDEQLYTLLLRLRDWNTNVRTTHVAQRILWTLAKSYPAGRLIRLKKRGQDLGDVLEALIAYTERHKKRCEELIDGSYLVDFIVKAMGEEAFVAEDFGMLTEKETDTDVVMIDESFDTPS